MNGVPTSTRTFIQPPPFQSTATPTSATQLLMNPGCSSWNCWTHAERTGTAVAIALFILGVMGLLWWGFCSKPRERMSRRDLESGRADSHPNHVGSRRSSRSRSPTSLSYTSSASSSRQSRQPQYQSYVRTRSRSRARAYTGERRDVQTHECPMQHVSQPDPSHHSHIRDFAVTAAAGLATAGTLGGIAGGGRTNTSAAWRPSIHERTAPSGRSQGRDIHVEDMPRRNTTRGRPRARSLSPTRGGRSKSSSKHFGNGFGMAEKWMALLLFGLDALYRLSEPKGGWDQFRRTDKSIEQQVEDFGHELFDSKHRERSRSPRHQYRESHRRSQSVDTAYAQLRPPRRRSIAEERSRDAETNRLQRRSMQDHQPKTTNQDPSDVSAAEERGGAVDLSQSPRRKMQEHHPKRINHEAFNISAKTEAGSRRSPSPLPASPIGTSDRRRITRREARRKRVGVGSASAGGTSGEASSAEDQRQRIREGGRNMLSSAPAPGQDRRQSFPFPLPNKTVSAPREMETALPVLAANPKQIQEPGAQQGQGKLLTPPDSESHH